MRVIRVLVTVAASALVVLSGATGAVWCIAEDHASVEMPVEQCCTGSAADEGSAVRLEESDCGPCLDLAVGGDAAAPPGTPSAEPSPDPAHHDVVAAPKPVSGLYESSSHASPTLDGTCLRL